MTSPILITLRPPANAGDPVLVSVIVPLAPNEPEPLALLALLPDAFEVVLARGGTRASSMNAAASRASGLHLWFVHADTVIEVDAITALLSRLTDPSPTLHYFDLRFDGGLLMRITELGVWFRSRVLGIPFGDQALCIPAAVFVRVDRYDETAVRGEDHLLVRQAHKAGVRVRPIGASVLTSARKYREQGWFRTTVKHLWLTLCQARSR